MALFCLNLKINGYKFKVELLVLTKSKSKQSIIQTVVPYTPADDIPVLQLFTFDTEGFMLANANILSSWSGLLLDVKSFVQKLPINH